MADNLSDLLRQMITSAGNSPDFMAALPTIAGAVLMARRDAFGRPSRIGAPLGAGLEALGLSMPRRAPQAAPTLFHNKYTGQYIPLTLTPGQPLPPGIEPISQSPRAKFEHYSSGGQTFDFDPNAGISTPDPNVPKAPSKPTTETLPQFYRRDPKGFSAYEKALHANDKGTNINVERPLGPGDVIRDDKGNPLGVLETDKAGHIKLGPVPAGLPAVSPKGKGIVTAPITLANGGKYTQEHPAGDPNNAILNRAEAAGWLGDSKPVTLWKIDGRVIDPRKQPPEKLDALAAKLKAKGLEVAPLEFTTSDGRKVTWSPP